MTILSPDPVCGADPWPGDRDPAPAEGDRPAVGAVPGRGPVRVVLAARTAHGGHVGLHQLAHHLQPRTDREKQPLTHVVHYVRGDPGSAVPPGAPLHLLVPPMTGSASMWIDLVPHLRLRFAWSVRGVVSVIAVAQQATEGRPLVGVLAGTVVALTYLVPAASRAKAARGEAAADTVVVRHGLGPAYAEMMERYRLPVRPPACGVCETLGRLRFGHMFARVWSWCAAEGSPRSRAGVRPSLSDYGGLGDLRQGPCRAAHSLVESGVGKEVGRGGTSR